MIDLLSVHNSLGHLLFAVQEEFKDVLATVELRYRSNIYLTVEIQIKTEKDQQIVVDRLSHGVLWGDYDYRFKGIMVPCGYPDGEWRTISAHPDMVFDNDRNKHLQDT